MKYDYTYLTSPWLTNYPTLQPGYWLTAGYPSQTSAPSCKKKEDMDNTVTKKEGTTYEREGVSLYVPDNGPPVLTDNSGDDLMIDGDDIPGIIAVLQAYQEDRSE